MEAKLPKIRFRKPPQWQSERLRKWLFEWNARLLLEEHASVADGVALDDSLSQGNIDFSVPNRQFDREVRPGDIRLIPCAMPNSQSLPLFCSVLSLWPEETETAENRLWVTCLFSSMGEPGLPSEWLTGEDFPFSSLSLWNSQLVAEGFLRESWCFETWENSTRQKALEIYKAWFLGEEIPTDLSEEVGPPIRHSDDPRNQYLLQEQKRGKTFCEAVQQWKLKQKPEIKRPIPDNLLTFPSPRASETALLAARDDAAERPLVTRLYRVADNPESTIQVSESIDPTKLAFEVMEDPSNLFAGADIFDASQKPLGKVEDGIAYVDCPEDSRFSLFAADGTPILLEYTSDEHRPKARLSLTDIRRSRSLMFFLRDEALDELSHLRCADPDLRQQLLVESVFRLWLYPKASPERRLKIAKLSKSLWDLAAAPEWPSYNILSAWLERSREKRCFDVPEELGHGPVRQVGELLRKRIDTWKNAAGVIPFVGLHDDLADAIALPFNIGPIAHKGGQVLGGDASVIKGLSDSLRAATSSEFLKDMSAHDIWIPDVDQSTAELLEGRSAGLPLFIALRGYLQSTSLPPFTIAATGILSDNGLLDPLAQTSETVARKVRMLREIGFDRILVAGPLDGCDSGPDVFACSSESDLSHQLQSLDSLHSQHFTLLRAGPHSIQKRLGEIDHEMTAGRMSPTEAKCQLQQLLKTLGDAMDIFSSEVRSELRLVLATAECHLGNPGASEALLDQISERKSVLGEFPLTKALIRQAVNLNDFGRYRDAADMVLKQLESIRSSTLSASQRIKLELDALGTAGQALTNLGLIDTQVRDQARECLTAACDLARQLGTPDSSRPELPQDLCYLYQWHAFFDRSGCDGVWKEFERVTPPDHSSWDFMKRLRWLAAYRALMEGDHFAWRHYEDDLPSRKSGNDVSWLYRLARKYRGALRAAEGDLEGSQQDFEEAVQLIPDSKTAPILQLLGVVAALEAVRSLSGQAPEAVAHYRTLAKETMESDLADFHHVDISRFREAADQHDITTIAAALTRFPY